MTVAIILFTQLQGDIRYPSDTDTFVLLFHRVIIPSDALCPGFVEKNQHIIVSLSRSPASCALLFSGNLPHGYVLIKWENRAGGDAAQVGRKGDPSWEGLVGWSVFGSRVATEYLPMFADTDG